MLMPQFDQSLSIGTLLTVLATTSGLLYNWRKDQQLKRKEYADKVRRAAGLTIAKLDRWKELAVRLFEDIQPALTESDGMLIKGHDVIATRDYVWKELVAARARSSQRILDEQIEIAYADLYGYDPRIQELFVAVVARLKRVDADCYELLLSQTQADVLSFEGYAEIRSANLGNALRTSAGLVARECHRLMENLIDAFRIEATKLIQASDYEIIAKRVGIRSAGDCLPNEVPLSVEFPPSVRTWPALRTLKHCGCDSVPVVVGVLNLYADRLDLRSVAGSAFFADELRFPNCVPRSLSLSGCVNRVSRNFFGTHPKQLSQQRVSNGSQAFDPHAPERSVGYYYREIDSIFSDRLNCRWHASSNAGGSIASCIFRPNR
jgi:hypothetical protein